MSPRNQLVPPSDASRSGHPGRRAATSLSGPRGLASLALVLATPGCLVTSTPDFSPPKRSAPVLITATALPDPRQVLIVDDVQDSIQFNAHFLTGNSGELPRFRLYLDYGAPDGQPGQPYRNEQKILYTDQGLDGGALPPVQTSWVASNTPPFDFGCHTLTLMASHEFDSDFTDCPVCKSDSSQITWQVYHCDKTNDPKCTMADFSPCQPQNGWVKSCPDTTASAAGQCGASP